MLPRFSNIGTLPHSDRQKALLALNGYAQKGASPASHNTTTCASVAFAPSGLTATRYAGSQVAKRYAELAQLEEPVNQTAP